MSKERRKLEAVSKGAVNLLDSTAVVGGESETAQVRCCSDETNDGAAPLSAVSAALGQTETAQVRCCSDETNDGAAPLSAVSAALGQTETKEAEGVVSGFVPNPTVMLVRLVTSGVVVPVIQVRAYLFRRGMAVRVYRAFDGWRLK